MSRSTNTSTSARAVKSATAIGITASALLLAGCDQLIDLAFDCIDRDGPEFNKTLLISPVLNQVYSETITVSIENEPQDDRFDYDFAISGQLPAGLQTQELGRQLIFSGTATELGDFQIQVSVEVSHRNGNLDSGLCFTTESQAYQLTVLPM